tara:strand:+ start:148 stop:438 length:291 start_codon:yes stop_codon:yes gene_type:complete
MSIEKLQQDILYCQETIGNIPIKHYDDQDKYRDMVIVIFKDILQDYLKHSGKAEGIVNICPDKLEPKEVTRTRGSYIPEEGLKKIRKSQGYKLDES